MLNSIGDRGQRYRNFCSISQQPDDSLFIFTKAFLSQQQLGNQVSVSPVYSNIFQHPHHLVLLHPIKSLFVVNETYIGLEILSILKTSFPEYSQCCNGISGHFARPEAKLIIRNVADPFHFCFNALSQYSYQDFRCMI